MPAVLEERPFGGFFYVFRKDGGENFYVTSSKHFYVILPSTPSWPPLV